MHQHNSSSKPSNEPMTPQDVDGLMRQATYASVFVALFLMLIKLVAFVVTGSVAILGALFDSGLDFAASLINLFAVRKSLSPPDKEHRFGHGKAEALAGLGQAILIAGSAVYLAIESYGRLANPEPITQSYIGIIVIVLSIGATFGLVSFQRYVVKKSGSIAISADQVHYRGDLLMNAGVLAAIIFAGVFGWIWVDSFLGLAISFYLAQASWEIVKQSYHHLLDHELPNEQRDEIKKKAMTHPEVTAIHDLRTRNAGSRQFIQFHLEMDPKITLSEAHRIADEVEASLLKMFPRADIIIHQDPAGLEKLTKLEKS